MVFGVAFHYSESQSYFDRCLNQEVPNSFVQGIKQRRWNWLCHLQPTGGTASLVWCPRTAFITCQIEVCLLIASSLRYGFNCERADEKKMLKCMEFCCGIKCQGSRRSQQEDIMGSSATDCSINLRKWVKPSLNNQKKVHDQKAFSMGAPKQADQRCGIKILGISPNT